MTTHVISRHNNDNSSSPIGWHQPHTKDTTPAEAIDDTSCMVPSSLSSSSSDPSKYRGSPSTRASSSSWADLSSHNDIEQTIQSCAAVLPPDDDVSTLATRKVLMLEEGNVDHDDGAIVSVSCLQRTFGLLLVIVAIILLLLVRRVRQGDAERGDFGLWGSRLALLLVSLVTVVLIIIFAMVSLTLLLWSLDNNEDSNNNEDHGSRRRSSNGHLRPMAGVLLAHIPGAIAAGLALGLVILLLHH
jgi:preprotein translocase subunit SecG